MLTRRQSLQVAAGVLAAPVFVRAADDRPAIALVGCGGMGRGDATNAGRFGRVVAVCDADAGRAAVAAKQFDAKPYADFRQMLDTEKQVAVVLNATPDHWHTLVNIAAVRRGKDVYGEKPLTLTVDEGKRLVAEVKTHGRVFQTGSQQRSDKLFRQACDVVRTGRLGKLTTVTSTLPAGLRGGPFRPSPVPAGLDWERWQGQAPATEYVTERCHTNFRFWAEYSGGSITDWGAHHNDIVRWALGELGPATVVGRPTAAPVPGGYSTFSEYEVEYTYPSGVVHRCVSTTASTIFGGAAKQPVPRSQMAHGIKFEGTTGWLFVTRGKLEASDPAVLTDPFAASDPRLPVSDDHMGNFFACVKSRQTPIADAEVGHRSVTVCHLGNIALRLGRKLTWDATSETFGDDRAANALLAREQRKPWTYDAV